MCILVMFEMDYICELANIGNASLPFYNTPSKTTPTKPRVLIFNFMNKITFQSALLLFINCS